MLDGRMLLTRPSEWKEERIGSVFKETSIHKLSKNRKEIRASEYIAHLVSHKDFEERMSILTDKYEPLENRFIFH